MFQILFKTVYKETYSFCIFPCCGHQVVMLPLLGIPSPYKLRVPELIWESLPVPHTCNSTAGTFQQGNKCEEPSIHKIITIYILYLLHNTF